MSEEPWLVLGAQAVKFDPNLKYILCKDDDEHVIMSEQRFKSLCSLTDKKLRPLLGVSSQDLTSMIVENPITMKDLKMVAVGIQADRYAISSGFHTVTPAHNHLDYLLANDIHLQSNGIINPATGRLQKS